LLTKVLISPNCSSAFAAGGFDGAIVAHVASRECGGAARPVDLFAGFP